MKKLLVVGLPASGKTTFLAALWHFIESAEIQGALTLQRQPDDTTYLNEIRDAWLECKRPERTHLGAEHVVSLLLRATHEKDEFEIYLPDPSGESFLSQWRDRKASAAHLELCQQATGVLLFLHPNRLQGPCWIVDADAILNDVEPDGGQAPPLEQIPPEPWIPEKAPTQVQLVDLLQTIAAHAATHPLRLTLIISAWDCLGQMDQTPQAWLQERLPLLHQYLTANPEVFTLRAYGISAQGGNIDDRAERDRLLGKNRPAERVIVVGPGSAEHDISAPLRWAMG